MFNINGILHIYCCILLLRIIIDTYIVAFNALNSRNQLEKIEEYEWVIVVALQNIFQVFYEGTFFYLIIITLPLLKQHASLFNSLNSWMILIWTFVIKNECLFTVA